MFKNKKVESLQLETPRSNTQQDDLLKSPGKEDSKSKSRRKPAKKKGNVQKRAQHTKSLGPVLTFVLQTTYQDFETSVEITNVYSYFVRPMMTFIDFHAGAPHYTDKDSRVVSGHQPFLL
jgi:hypothetical protein